MSDEDGEGLDPETFEREKFREFFPQLQRAYKGAFDTLNEQYDSTLVHAIDQQILNESEPVYEGAGSFRIQLPDDPIDRVHGVAASPDRIEAILEIYLDELESELRDVFGVEASDDDG